VYKSEIIADYLEKLKGQVLDRWRVEVRGNPEQREIVQKLDDQELQDHLPVLTDNIIQCLRGESLDRLEEAAARHAGSGAVMVTRSSLCCASCRSSAGSCSRS
jgi:hypothetical protein